MRRCTLALLGILTLLSACAPRNSLPTTDPGTEIYGDVRDVLIDQSFKTLILRRDAGKEGLIFFMLSIRQIGYERQRCAAIYVPDIPAYAGLSSFDLVTDSIRIHFDRSNAIIAISQPGEKFSFVTPNHLARCVVVPSDYSLRISQPHFELWTPGSETPITLNVFLSII